MLKIEDIQFIDHQKILCFFNTGDKRVFNVVCVINDDNKFSQKLMQPLVFRNAKIGVFGQLYWDGIAEMKNYDGEFIPCEYDISPEFVFNNSIAVS